MPPEMTLNEARAIGYEKLKISKDLFDKSLEVTKEFSKTAKDIPPMTLIIAILGATESLTKALKEDSDEEWLFQEMSDAVQLMKMAEREWRMEQVVGKGRA